MQSQEQPNREPITHIYQWVRSLPLLNIRANTLELFNPWQDLTYRLSQVEMTKADYDEISDDWKGPDPLTCRRFSVRVVMMYPTGGAILKTVFLTDCPEDTVPGC